jgi:hypothetical protein
MSAFPWWRGPHGLGTFLARQVLIAHGVMGDGELQDPCKTAARGYVNVGG